MRLRARNRRSLIWLAIAPALALGAALAAGTYFRLPLPRLAEQGARALAAQVLRLIYAEDMEFVRARTSSYWHGLPEGFDAGQLPPANPFVYEDPQAPYLAALRERFGLDRLVTGAGSEYEAILKLGGWVGSQFDHGTDPVAGGDKVCDPVRLIEEGRAGGRYWCEIAARLMAHSAASVGLPARVVTVSRDGYTWEHAVAEVWSNEFRKWFVVDADFNMVYEHAGVPLSAIELLQRGEALKSAGELQVRRIAPAKPSIPPGDALYVYRYVHVDLRTDWCSRTLRRGSPAGGDAATWWYAVDDIDGRLLSGKKRLADPGEWNWTLNVPVAFTMESQHNGPTLVIAAFSPYFSHFEIDLGNGWERAAARLSLPATREARVRVVTDFGWKGAPYRLESGKLTAEGVRVPAPSDAGPG